jgi:IS605 OrfB family transposase
MLRAYQYAILPTEGQKLKLARFFGSCPFVYNLALETRRYAYRSQRNHFHKVSTVIIRCFDTICLEDLNIQGMMQNEKLALSIGEVGWFKFTTMLEYKAQWYGKNILCTGRFTPSSRLCFHCEEIIKELRLKDRSWACQVCSTHHNRDENAAKNIKTFGLRNQPSTVNASRGAVRMG